MEVIPSDIAVTDTSPPFWLFANFKIITSFFLAEYSFLDSVP